MLHIMFGLLLNGSAAGDGADELLDQAIQAARKGQVAEAIELGGKAIAKDAKKPRAYVHRASWLEATGKFKEAAADLDQAIALEPQTSQHHHQRGCLHFKAGHIKESIRDFDKYIELEPKAKVSHWQRGISYYYAGQYDEGRKQFEGYQTFDSADVENAVWRFMCMARKDTLAAARKDILKVDDDKRLVMKEVYEMFAGKMKPAEVLAVAETEFKRNPKDTRPPFYAHLYIGIYLDLEGKRKDALEHLEKAVSDYRIGHYMWDVARVHRDILKK